MANEDEGSTFTQCRQCVVQFHVQLRKSAWLWARIAPGVATAVVSANAGEERDARLHQGPVKGEIAEPIFDDYGGLATTAAIHVKFMAAQIHQFSGWGGRGRNGPSRAADNEEWNFPDHWATGKYEFGGRPVAKFQETILA
jgi:hypothetical protein